MVQLQNPETGSLSFNKLDDPKDTAFSKAYKHLFRYASPNLLLWGPLAPAHDALLPRAAMASLQIGIGAATLYGTFRTYRPSIGAFRRRFSRLSCLLAGSALIVTGLKEISYDMDPLSNPLYIEIQLAREFGPERLQTPTPSSYWNGPKNFMPMNNDQYWKMIYSLDLNQVMVDEYQGSELMEKFTDLVSKYNEKNSKLDGVLTDKIGDVVKSTSKNENYRHRKVPFSLMKENNEGKLKSKTLGNWFKGHPMDSLQLSEHKEYLDYDFPRMKIEEPSDLTEAK
ncbi:DEKNAAC101201 [Brettanomyces naardenensis]|uniref:DEKNAAC101201 n=1 Tax=Brettanomyces naardenensis TaxID=13370 RepID=A0A448YHJ7_BRENA|nr:DEKNAAC101201 [Brettanomyces naardenensis]